jgi:hypothetical protein
MISNQQCAPRKFLCCNKKKKRANSKWRLEFLRKKKKILGILFFFFCKMSMECDQWFYIQRGRRVKVNIWRWFFFFNFTSRRSNRHQTGGLQLFGEDFFFDWRSIYSASSITKRVGSIGGLLQHVYDMYYILLDSTDTPHAILCRKKSGTLDTLLLLLLLFGGEEGLWILLFRRSETSREKRTVIINSCGRACMRK